ncbi:Host cell factor [Thelohanellus kitauei]|uniref:Host cell factor n=1 Tax=Thelohanellus kitauei TaxID=669202 RepID=A0A0C2JDG8_THEKT|nr:Host cell factor [Thelohanellus kitauei]
MDTVFKTAEIIKHPKSMIPKNRFGHCMIAVDELVIIYGGKTFEDSVLDELWMYDSVRQKWRLFCLPQLLKSTCFNSSICAHGSKIYIFGGTNLPGSEYIQTTLFSFDVRSFKWRNLFSHLNNSENRPRQIEMTNILYHNDSIYILGVVDVRYRNLVGAMYKFCLKTFKWSVIPYKGDVPHPNCKGHCTVFQNK